MSHESHQQAAAGLSVRFAVLTLSDTRTLATDASGTLIVERLLAEGHRLRERLLIPDDADVLRSQLRAWINADDVDTIITTGGTGISRRDVTAAVVESLLDAPLPGFGELFRALSHAHVGSAALLSRCIAGVAGRTFIAALPGSTNAVALAVSELLIPQLRHVVHELRK